MKYKKGRGQRGEKNGGFRCTGNEEDGQTKATMDGHNQGGHEREGHTTRADAILSCVEATRQTHRPHMKWDKIRKKKRSEEMAIRRWVILCDMIFLALLFD